MQTLMVDKDEAKKYVADRLRTDENIIPTIAVYNNVNDIQWDKLPNQFVVKCTHGSGDLVICRDKKTFDVNAAKKILKRYKKIWKIFNIIRS